MIEAAVRAASAACSVRCCRDSKEIAFNTAVFLDAMAQASAVSRLIVYVATCAAALRLRSPRFAGVVPEPTMRVPLGPVIPVLAILIALAILFGATAVQLRAGAIALVAGAVLFAVAAVSGRKR